MTDAELDQIIEAGTVRVFAAAAYHPPIPLRPYVTLPVSLAADLVRAARELREFRNAAAKGGAR
jgi:hypothetical protein